MSLLFENQYKKSNKVAFLAKVQEVSKKLLISPDWLMAVMYKESRLSAQARNVDTQATGLIQFMPKTAIGLSTSVAALYKMDELQQLDYVYKHYRPFRLRLNSYPDLYKATIFPISLGKPANWVFRSKDISATAFARANPATDINKDGQTTVAELEEYLYKDFSPSVVALLKKKNMSREIIKWGIIVSFVALLTFSGIMIYRTIKTEKR